MATIESRDLDLSEVFKDFYSVPDFQREYVWQESQVEQLLTDIRTEQSDGGDADYFIGSIVTCPARDGRLVLIDGQQRMTTIFVAFCALRDRFNSIGDTQLDTVKRLIADTKIDGKGNESFSVRIQLQYEDAGNVFSLLTNEQALPSDGPTRSIQNIATAYETCLDFFVSEFAEDRHALREYYGYLVNRVKLIRIETDSLARALKIFETINDRGVGLDAMDLLKNLLFMKSTATEFEILKLEWKKLTDALYAAGEKPLRFLRYYILSEYGVEKLREDELYAWFVKNEKKVGFDKKPLPFVRSLNYAVTAYLQFAKGLTPSGERDPDLLSLSALTGKATRQHLIILLAARSSPKEIFSAVCRDLERLIITYLIARQTNREFEVLFPGWAAQLSEVKSIDDYHAFANVTFRKRRSELSRRFIREFAALDTMWLKKYQLRYIVAKLTQAVDLAGFGGASEGHRWLSRYLDAANHIEHIAPVTPSSEAVNEFGDGATELALIWSIGNLALAESAINGSLGNKPFSRKKAVYSQSQFLLTRTISSTVKIGNNTAIDRAVAGIKPFETWNRKNVGDRAQMLAELAGRVWDIQPSEATIK